MSQADEPTGHEDSAQRAKQIQRVLDQCLRQRAAGGELPDDAIVAQHPELMPELEERLAALKLIEDAGRHADDSAASSAPSAAADADSSNAKHPFEGRCPHCGARWRLKAEFAGRRVRCRKCGQGFVADEGSSAAAAQMGVKNDSRTSRRAAGLSPRGAALPGSIPGYEVEEELGHGGMGCVYRARELATKRTVALKVMLAGRYASERHRRRFEREVEIAAALQHPHIARLYASGLHQGHHWFAMEYVEGEQLDAHAEREQLGIRDTLSLFARICAAVNHAHQRGIIHRDLKPGNILVDQRHQPRVLDFGLAKLMDRPAALEESISLEGEVVGTPAYMSPEQTQGDPAKLDIRTDVYSLGVILYRLLTGQSPYDEPRASARAAEDRSAGPRSAGPPSSASPRSAGRPSPALSLPELLRAINEVQPTPPRRVRKEIPDEVNSIVLKALEKQPDRRYQTAGELGRDIEAYLSGEPVTAKQGSGWYTLRKTALRYKGPATAVAAVVVISLGLGLTMSALFAKTVIEYRDVVREVQVVREGEAAADQALRAQLADALQKLAGAELQAQRALVALNALRDGKPLFVNARATAANTGETWSDGYTDLQELLKLAIARHQIWVAAGTYKPAGPNGDRTASFQLKSGIALYGGFAGNETKREQREPKKNETILSGDLNGDDGPDFANNNENSYHVVTSFGLDERAILDGFVISAGNANDEGGINDGGGMFNVTSSPTVVNCVFKRNYAIDGGGMANDARSSPKVKDCAFVGNRAGRPGGAGMWNWDRSNPTLTNCTFDRNRADGNGGAILNRKESAPRLKSCTLVANSAAQGAAIFNDDGGSPRFVSCLFARNRARVRGGAARNISRCDPLFVNCVFSANVAEQENGGVMHNHDASPTLVNCTMVGNSAAGVGGGFNNVDQSDVRLSNCILWGNTEHGETSENAQIDEGFATVNYCCVQGWSGQWGGQGNIGDDPLFVDADGPDNIPGTEDDDLRLRPNSPCIDRGDTAALPPDTLDLDADGDTDEPIPLDLAGKPRVFNDAVDIGAYEGPGDELATRWSLIAPDGRTVYPPLPNPAEPVNYIAWVNEEMSKGLTENAADNLLAMHPINVRSDVSIPRDNELHNQFYDALDGPWLTGKPELSRWLRRMQPVLAEFRKAARKRHCFYPWWTETPRWYLGLAEDEPYDADPWDLNDDPRMKDWSIRVLLPSLSLARRAGEALIAEGWQAWRQGNHELLPANALLVLRCARHHENQYILISKLVGVAMATEGYAALGNALAVSEDPGALASHFAPELAAADTTPPSVSRQFRGEHLLNCDTCQRVFMPGDRAGSWQVYTPMYRKLAEAAQQLGNPPAPEVAAAEIEKLAGIGFDETLREIDRHFDAMVAWSETPYHQAAQGWQEIEKAIKGSDNRLVSRLLPSLSRARVLCERRVAERRGTHLVFYLFAHRARTGGFPTALRYLDAPDLGELRIDPFSGKDFVYKRTGDSFILYSVGHNLMDDGGKHHPKWGQELEDGVAKTVEGDFVFWPVQK